MHPLSKFQMKNLLYRTFYAFILLFCSSTYAFSSDTKQLITMLTVIDNDSTFHSQYIYDKLSNVLLETKYYNQNGLWVRQTQTEKSFTGYNCNSQRERVWNNSWMTTFSINYSYLNGILVTETQNTTYSCFSKSFKMECIILRPRNMECYHGRCPI